MFLGTNELQDYIVTELVNRNTMTTVFIHDGKAIQDIDTINKVKSGIQKNIKDVYSLYSEEKIYWFECLKRINIVLKETKIDTRYWNYA